MQTNQLNSDRANISSHGNKTSRKGFLRWTRLAAAGALVLTLALACTTPAPETADTTAVAPTERAEELPTATASTAPAEAPRESEAEKTPEAEPFEGTLRFIVVNSDDDSAARLAALNDQHGFESLFKARVGIESGVSAIAEIDMRDPAGRVMVRLKKDMPEGQTQPSEMAVKDLALSTETEAVIYQNEAEGLVFFWTESLGQAQFAPATQEMVGKAIAAPMFDVRRDKTGDANWIKAVVSADAQGASVYQLTHESDDRGTWVKLANPITVLERETIFAEAGAVAEAEGKLRSEVLSVELLRSFGYDSWEKVGEEQGKWLRSIVGGTDLTGLQGEMQTAINNGTFYDADGNISVEWKNRGLELMMGVMKDKLKAELDTLTDPEAEGVDYPRLLETVITINGKAIPISLHHGSALYNLYRDKSVWDYTTSVPGLISTYLDPDFQTGISTIFEQFLVDQKLDVKAGFAESSFVIRDGKIVNVGEVADARRVGVEKIDKIEFYELHEQEFWVLEHLQRDTAPYALNPHYDGDAATPFIDFIWFVKDGTLSFVHIQPGNINKDRKASLLWPLYRNSISTAMTDLTFAFRAKSLESGVGSNEFLDSFIKPTNSAVRRLIDEVQAK